MAIRYFTMTARIAGQRFRQRKLSTKQNVAVLRESEVEKLIDDEAQRHIPKVETGVEKGEEIVSFILISAMLPLYTSVTRIVSLVGSRDARFPRSCWFEFKKLTLPIS